MEDNRSLRERLLRTLPWIARYPKTFGTVGFFAVSYAAFNDVRDFVADASAVARIAVGAPDHLWLRWALVGAGIIIICLGALRKDRTQTELNAKIAQAVVDRDQLVGSVRDSFQFQMDALRGELALNRMMGEYFVHNARLKRAAESVTAAAQLVEAFAQNVVGLTAPDNLFNMRDMSSLQMRMDFARQQIDWASAQLNGGAPNRMAPLHMPAANSVPVMPMQPHGTQRLDPANNAAFHEGMSGNVAALTDALASVRNQLLNQQSEQGQLESRIKHAAAMVAHLQADGAL